MILDDEEGDQVCLCLAYNLRVLPKPHLYTVILDNETGGHVCLALLNFGESPPKVESPSG